jgi:hypothetical protein
MDQNKMGMFTLSNGFYHWLMVTVSNHIIKPDPQMARVLFNGLDVGDLQEVVCVY